MRRRGVSDRERRQMAAGRVLGDVPESVLGSLYVFLGAVAEMDRSRCGECGGALDGEATVCAALDPTSTVLTFMALCGAHGDGHDGRAVVH